MAGVPIPENWAGRNLQPVLKGSKKHGIDHAISEWADTESQFRNYTHRLIRTPHYKLIRWDKPDKPDELYNLVADPHETTNIINKPAMRPVRDQLLSQLNTWMKKTNDPFFFSLFFFLLEFFFYRSIIFLYCKFFKWLLAHALKCLLFYNRDEHQR